MTRGSTPYMELGTRFNCMHAVGKTSKMAGMGTEKFSVPSGVSKLTNEVTPREIRVPANRRTRAPKTDADDHTEPSAGLSGLKSEAPAQKLTTHLAYAISQCPSGLKSAGCCRPSR